MNTVRCLMQGTVIYSGFSTHARYVFSEENNHILLIDDSDLDDILSKKDIQGGCCGSPRTEKSMFELIE